MIADRSDYLEGQFKWVVTTDPGAAAAYNGLGLIAIQRQDPGAARGYFEKAVARSMPKPRPFLNQKDFRRARVNACIHRVCHVIAARRQDTCGGWSGP